MYYVKKHFNGGLKMACYKFFEDRTNVYVEQNIWDKHELESYDAKIETVTGLKTSVLYCYTKNDEVFYTLGLLENLRGENVLIVVRDLTDIFRNKTAASRRKKIYSIIRNHLLTQV